MENIPPKCRRMCDQEMFNILLNFLRLPEVYLMSDERLLKILMPE